MATCSELTLLRLQDIWLGKFITSGLVMPAGKLNAEHIPKSNSSKYVGALAVHMAFVVFLVGSESAIGATISCDAPYSAIPPDPPHPIKMQIPVLA